MKMVMSECFETIKFNYSQKREENQAIFFKCRLERGHSGQHKYSGSSDNDNPRNIKITWGEEKDKSND